MVYSLFLSVMFGLFAVIKENSLINRVCSVCDLRFAANTLDEQLDSLFVVELNYNGNLLIELN